MRHKDRNVRGIARLATLGAVALATLASGACGSSAGGTDSDVPGVTDSQILIGSNIPLKGPLSFVGEGFRIGENLAISEINSHGGINGRKLKVVYQDDEGTAAGGVSAGRRLVQQDKVFAVLSGGASTSVVAMTPFFRQSKVPLYDSVASDTAITDPFSKYVFMGATSPREAVSQSISDFITEGLSAKRVALLLDDEAQCQTGGKLVKEDLKKAGSSVETTQNYHAGDTNFSVQAQALKKANPDATYICGLASDAGKVLPALSRAQVPGKLVGDGSFLDPAAIKAAGQAAEGVYTFNTGSTQYINDPTGPNGEFLDRVKEANPDLPSDEPNHYAVFGYSDTYVFAEGLKNAGKDLTRESFIKALEEIDGFVAGKGSDFSFAVPLALPRTFSSTDHVGNKSTQPMIVQDGTLKPAPGYEP